METAAHLFRETRQKLSGPQRHHNKGQQRSGAVPCAAGPVSPTLSTWGTVWTPRSHGKDGNKKKNPLCPSPALYTLYPVPPAQPCAQYSTNHVKKPRNTDGLHFIIWSVKSHTSFDLNSLSICFPVTHVMEAIWTPRAQSACSQPLPDTPITSQISISAAQQHIPLLPSVTGTQCRASLTTGKFLYELFRQQCGLFLCQPLPVQQWCPGELHHRLLVPILTPDLAAHTLTTSSVHLKTSVGRPCLVFLPLNSKDSITDIEKFSYSLQKPHASTFLTRWHFWANQQKEQMRVLS